MTVRTRIAPSPTGDPHVGTAYIALFNLCFARQHQGKFILRIEDTDQQRSTAESEQQIFESLRWLGLDWDEGPDVGGEFGPYRQSERGDIYGQYAQELLDKGKAFKCYRTSEELDTLRRDRQLAGHSTALKPSDLYLPIEEVNKREAANAPYVVRMLVPEHDGACVVDDLLRGKVALDWSMVDAQILLKSDGMPTYHLANVVDDHLMQITHVMRGEEWLNSAPKHKLLYEYFGWEMPVLCHLPLLRNPDKSKLSKRKNPTSINFYQRMGYFPAAMLNYLGRMGWSMPNEQEKFSLEEMIANFDIGRVSLGGPVFDVEKLSWLNGLYLREDFNDEQLIAELMKWAFNSDYIKQIIPQLRPRIEVLSDVAPLASFFFSGMPKVTKEDYLSLGFEEDNLVELLQFLVWEMDNLSPWNKDAIFATVKALADHADLKIKVYLQPVFMAISGSTTSTSVLDAMVILGPDMSRARLRFALDLVSGGGVSKKLTKKLEKAYQEFKK